MSDLLCCIAAIGLHLGSAHIDPTPGLELNNRNPGVHIELQNGLTAGTYYNSIRRQSVYAGYSMNLPKVGPIEPAIFFGGITGYTNGLWAAIVPSAYLPLGDFGLRLAYIPKVTATKVHTIHLMIEHRF